MDLQTYVMLVAQESQSGGGGGGGGGAYLGNPSVRGLDFYLGETQDDYRGFTGFRLLELEAKGEIGWIEDYIGFCFAEIGANAIRFFCRWGNTGYCPESDPHFYDHFHSVMERLKRFGGYGHPVISCDQVPGSNVLTTDEKLAESAKRIAEICREVGNAFPCETENEPFKNGMKGRAWPAEWFAGLVACRGTWYVASDIDPELENGSWLSCVTVHPGGDREWVSEGGHLCHEVMRGDLGHYAAPEIPCLVGEPVRMAENGVTAEMYADHAWNCRNMGRGSLLHGGFWSLNSGTKHHASDLQNCKAPTREQFPEALRTCELVRDMWRSPLWIKESASQGQYTRASVAPPGEGVPGYVPGVGDTIVFPQNDGSCPLTHWDRYIDAQGVRYEDPRGATRTYFMKMLDGRAIGGPLDKARECKPEPRLGYTLVNQTGPIWILRK